MPTQTRKEILEAAIQCVCDDRQNQYGEPENSFALIGRFWTEYLDTDKPISAHDVGIMMALLKIARIQAGQFKADSYVDACGYLACAGAITSQNE